MGFENGRDYFRKRYEPLLSGMGMDPAQLDDDAKLRALYDMVGGLSDADTSAVGSFLISNNLAHLPEGFPDRIRTALASGSIDSARAQRADVTQGSGGLTTAVDALGMAADLAGSTLPLTPPAPSVSAPSVPPAGPHIQAGYAETAGAVDLPNVSDGGPGTSTAKGEDTIRKQVAKRAGGGKDFAAAADSALGAFDLGIGEVARDGLHRAGAAARSAGMPKLGRGLYRLGSAARFAAPALAVGGAVLPAAMGAMEGFNQAGVGGAAIQGGTGLGGAALGAAIGSAFLPGVGTVIGAGLGSMAGSGIGSALTSGAVGLVEKGQTGDRSVFGAIGRALDPVIDTAFEKEQKAALQQMNSPAMQEIRAQERARMERARALQAEQMLMQASMRVI